ncbi:MAG: sigma-70 family RNA polymerase sigma factor [Planctomycetota bacterium]
MFNEDLLRHEYSRLVSVLVHEFGARCLPDIEDAVQAAMFSAVQKWQESEKPENPTAWLYRVARNQLIDDLRKADRRRKLLKRESVLLQADPANGKRNAPSAYEESLLHMLFLCCDPAVPEESRLAFMLRTLCGFSIPEISARLFSSEANIYKRIARARDCLRRGDVQELNLDSDEFRRRLPSVRKALYLMFTEGYLSIDPDNAIRLELCEEATRLSLMLAENPRGDQPETSALVALMLLNSARLAGRQARSGGLLFLEEQDRSQWNHDLVGRGIQWLSKSASGEQFTRFHCEAGIAATHCLAPSYGETKWQEIVRNYEVLFRIVDIPVHRLNHAMALAEIKGAKAGLATLENYLPPSWLSGSYLWFAVMADLNFRSENFDAATRDFDLALATAPSESIRNLIRRRLRHNQDAMRG